MIARIIRLYTDAIILLPAIVLGMVIEATIYTGLLMRGVL